MMIKRFIMIIASMVVIFGLSGCGGGDNSSEESVLEGAPEKTLSSPGPFSAGDFGEIKLSSDLAAVNAELKDAALIDIRTAWERGRYGYPKDFVNIPYQNRDYQEDGHYNTKPLNPTFVEDVNKLVGGDLHKKIVLICDSSSRSGAHTNKDKESAAKLLSDKGFSNVYHIYGGFRGNSAGDYENGWLDYHLPLGE
jgi:rhodanese-related sulfurtransferase